MVPLARKQSFDLAEDQAMDVYTLASGKSEGAVLLWHGSGPRERTVMSPLAERVAAFGLTVYVPDWSSDAEDRGVADLLRSLDFVVDKTVGDPSATSRMVLAGWSAGASAAMAIALKGDQERRPSAVVAIAGRYDGLGPLGEVSPMNMSTDPPSALTIRLVHGRSDEVVPDEQSELLFNSLSESGWACTLTLVDADHAGVIGCRYDEQRGLCVPSPDEGAGEVLRNVAALFDLRV